MEPGLIAASIAAVLIYGVSKGGFGGGLGVAAVPLMALVMSPARAAAILLPVLVLMDLIGLVAYRGRFERRAIATMLPAAIGGIVAASLAFRYFSDDAVRLLVGLVAIGFSLNHFLRRGAAARPPAPQRPLLGAFWGAIAGFTSTLAHSGGPPANVYLLPLKLEKSVFVGTMIVLFAAMNVVKLVPFVGLGLLDTPSLKASAMLAPLAALGMGLGIWLHKRVDERLFYRLCYLFVLLTGLKLAWDALT